MNFVNFFKKPILIIIFSILLAISITIFNILYPKNIDIFLIILFIAFLACSILFYLTFIKQNKTLPQNFSDILWLLATIYFIFNINSITQLYKIWSLNKSSHFLFNIIISIIIFMCAIITCIIYFFTNKIKTFLKSNKSQTNKFLLNIYNKISNNKFSIIYILLFSIIALNIIKIISSLQFCLKAYYINWYDILNFLNYIFITLILITTFTLINNPTKKISKK